MFWRCRKQNPKKSQPLPLTFSLTKWGKIQQLLALQVLSIVFADSTLLIGHQMLLMLTLKSMITSNFQTKYYPMAE
jgi:hypothetical protein